MTFYLSQKLKTSLIKKMIRKIKIIINANYAISHQKKLKCLIYQFSFIYFKVKKKKHYYIENKAKYSRMNQNNNEEENNRGGSNRSKQIIFIIAIYIMLVMSSRFGSKSPPNSMEKAVAALKSDITPSVITMMGIFQVGTRYQGQWEKMPLSALGTDSQLQSSFEFQQSGKSKTQFTSITQNQITFALMIENGEYMDDGYMYTIFDLREEENKTRISMTRQGKSAILTFESVQNTANNSSQNNLPTTTYKIQKIFNTIEIGITTIKQIQFNFTLINDNSIQCQTSVETAKFNLSSEIHGKQSFMIRTIFFAFLAFIISYFTFNSVLNVLRRIIEGSQSAQKFSLVSVLIATLWDSILCLVCFVQAFTNQENLILFILPSFMLCILFTNLELRWMLSIFQSQHHSLDLRTIICRFNLISYGSFLLVYPILLFTNLNQWLFIGISLIFLPQIYVNAQKGIRPDLNHPYYSKFLMFRFIVLFYVRGFPYNVFQLKPDYLLCLICLALLAAQYSLLWIQKIYGPKKIFPKFMLPPVFDYKLQEEINIQEGGDIPECAICLTALHLDPDSNQLQMRAPGAPKEQIKLMKTPCNHKYHSKCLQEWMNIKKQCPQCRKVLPPYE